MQFRLSSLKTMFPSKISQNIKLQFFKFINISHLTVFTSCLIFPWGEKGLYAIVFRTKKMYSIKGLVRAKLLGSGQFRRVKAPERTIGGDLRGWYIYDRGAVCHLLHNRADSTLVKSIKPTVRGCSTAQTRDKASCKNLFPRVYIRNGWIGFRLIPSRNN